jgi:hypothetical protein
MNASAYSSFIRSDIERRTGSCTASSGAPARLSSQLALQVIAVGSPVVSDFGRAVGRSSPAGAVMRFW